MPPAKSVPTACKQHVCTLPVCPGRPGAAQSRCHIPSSDAQDGTSAVACTSSWGGIQERCHP
eukprot:6108450-Pyramimonas_sp.AAC.1